MLLMPHLGQVDGTPHVAWTLLVNHPQDEIFPLVLSLGNNTFKGGIHSFLPLLGYFPHQALLVQKRTRRSLETRTSGHFGDAEATSLRPGLRMLPHAR
jgi:hypothetical protein